MKRKKRRRLKKWVEMSKVLFCFWEVGVMLYFEVVIDGLYLYSKFRYQTLWEL